MSASVCVHHISDTFDKVLLSVEGKLEGIEEKKNPEISAADRYKQYRRRLCVWACVCFLCVALSFFHGSDRGKFCYNGTLCGRKSY